MTEPAANPRDALKARHRCAILQAATGLIAERGGPRFSVDELAERAGIARRTVFNHFTSIDDVVLTACTQVLAVVVENFQAAAAATPVGDGSRSAMFEEIAQTLRSTDLVTAIAYLWPALGGGAADDPRARRLVHEAFSRISEQLAAEAMRRNATADPLDVELMVASLMNGLVVIAVHWIHRTDAATDDDSRAAWRELMDRLITSVRTGYMPVA
ncbi:TetR/AcrR family transcriptional regulator [Cellulomonas sp. P22]|uniref:TetR/AcrR family transcriptional regulator n=1 Tax=Cellulomonas sp. P22 TaxID=3373189 RepID=UPI0037AC1BA5